MNGVRGFNALQIILASGYPGLTEIGHVPASVIRLAGLAEPVSLVRTDHNLNFHLAANPSDPIRRDTAIYPWIVVNMPSVVTSPDYFLGSGARAAFQLIKRVEPPELYPFITYVRVPIKFVASSKANSRSPELWIRTIVLHSEDSIARLLNRGTRIGV